MFYCHKKAVFLASQALPIRLRKLSHASLCYLCKLYLNVQYDEAASYPRISKRSTIQFTVLLYSICGGIKWTDNLTRYNMGGELQLVKLVWRLTWRVWPIKGTDDRRNSTWSSAILVFLQCHKTYLSTPDSSAPFSQFLVFFKAQQWSFDLQPICWLWHDNGNVPFPVCWRVKQFWLFD